MNLRETIKNWLAGNQTSPDIQPPHWFSELQPGMWIYAGGHFGKVLSWDKNGILTYECHKDGETWVSSSPIRFTRMATYVEIPVEHRAAAYIPATLGRN